MTKIGKEEFLGRVQEFLKISHTLDEEWVVSSTPFGCRLGCSKIYLRRKRGKLNLRVHICSRCLRNEEVKRIKSQIRELLREQS